MERRRSLRLALPPVTPVVSEYTANDLVVKRIDRLDNFKEQQ
jgi:hypothetical protein